MARKRKEDSDQEYSDHVAAQRAIDALRRALTTPHKPQKQMIGKVGRPSGRKPKPVKKPPGSP